MKGGAFPFGLAAGRFRAGKDLLGSDEKVVGAIRRVAPTWMYSLFPTSFFGHFMCSANCVIITADEGLSSQLRNS